MGGDRHEQGLLLDVKFGRMIVPEVVLKGVKGVEDAEEGVVVHLDLIDI